MKSDQEASVTIGNSKWLKCFQTAGGSGIQDQRFWLWVSAQERSLLHLVGSVCLVFLDDRQRVSLSVEDPVVERQVVVVREEQVEIPEGDTEEET